VARLTVSDDFDPLTRAVKGGTRRQYLCPGSLGLKKKKDKKKKRSRNERRLKIDFDESNSESSKAFIGKTFLRLRV